MQIYKCCILAFCCRCFSGAQASLKEVDLEILSRLYGVEKPLFFKPLRGGIANTPTYVYTLLNETEVGLGVFKREGELKEMAAMKFIFLEKMKNNGFRKLPQIIKNVHGEYLSNINEKNYSCIEYLLPDPCFKKNLFSQMLQLIGQFHAAASAIPNGEVLKKNMIEAYIKRLHFFTDEHLEKNDPSFFSEPLWNQIVRLSKVYATSEFENIYHHLPSQIIHGDAHCNNIVVSNQTSYFIDFDMMYFGVRIWDLACCILFDFFDEYLKKNNDKTLFSFIEKNYGMKLDLLEEKYLMEFVKFRAMEVIGWTLQMMKLSLDNQDLKQYTHYKEFLVKLSARIEKLLLHKSLMAPI